MKREPIITTATITAAVSAVIGVLVAFGVPLTDGQTEAILILVGVAAPLIVIIARKWTWSDESHRADKAKAIEETARAYGWEEVPDADA